MIILLFWGKTLIGFDGIIHQSVLFFKMVAGIMPNWNKPLVVKRVFIFLFSRCFFITHNNGQDALPVVDMLKHNAIVGKDILKYWL